MVLMNEQNERFVLDPQRLELEKKPVHFNKEFILWLILVPKVSYCSQFWEKIITLSDKVLESFNYWIIGIVGKFN